MSNVNFQKRGETGEQYQFSKQVSQEQRKRSEMYCVYPPGNSHTYRMLMENIPSIIFPHFRGNRGYYAMK